jgi:hypothetical protein
VKDEKYVVLLAGQAWRFTENGYLRIPSQDGSEQLLTVLDDAVVIRTGDIFAASGLYAYAHTIHTHIELVRRFHGDTIDYSTETQLQRLGEIRDYFMDRAHEAEEKYGKVPD